jgi:hypothetical protein
MYSRFAMTANLTATKAIDAGGYASGVGDLT